MISGSPHSPSSVFTVQLRRSLLVGVQCWHLCRCLNSQWMTSSPRANLEAASWHSMPSFYNASTVNTQQPMRGGRCLWLTHGPVRFLPGLRTHPHKLTLHAVLFWVFLFVIANKRLCCDVSPLCSGPCDEAKLLLWWHKSLNLSVEQLQPQAGLSEVSGVIMNLMKLQTRLLQLGEERVNSGLLAAIGLGKRSPVSNQ